MNRLLIALLLCLGSMQAFSAIQIVQARNFFYLPADFAIDLGDTIRFIWVEGNHPTASVTGDFASFPLDAANPIHDLVLTSAGTFPYECVLHAGLGMVGTITVNASTAPCSLTTGPSGLSASPGTTNVALSWNVLPNSQGYQIQGRMAGTIPFGAVISTANSKTVGGLSPGQTYQWKVRALCVGTDDITPFSPLNSFTTLGSRLSSTENWPGNLPVLEAGQLQLSIPDNIFSQGGTPAAGYQMRLYTIDGTMIQSYSGLPAGPHRLDIPEISAGIYLLELTNGVDSWTTKIYSN